MSKTNDKRVLFVLIAIFFIDAVVISFFSILYFWGSPFLAYGIRTDLRDYENKVLKINMDEKAKNYVFEKLDEIRISVDKKNNFSFFKWINFSDSLTDILKDDQISQSELKMLHSDIKQMQKIQNIKEEKPTAEAPYNSSDAIEKE